MNRRIDPLSPEERDLAERLARLGGPREPAPALDAAILAAARAAVASPATDTAPSASSPAPPADPKIVPLRPRPGKPRWPLGFGLAASLVLAAGIGWKLQGDGEGSSAEAVQSAAPAEHDEAIEAVMIDPPAAPPPPPPMEAAADAEAPPAAVAPGARRQAEPVFEAPASVVADAAPMAAQPVPERVDAFSSAEPAPVAQAKATEDKAELDSVQVTGSRVAGPQRSVGAAEYTRTPLNQRREQSTAEREAAAPPPPAPPAPAAPPPPPPPAERARSGNVAERDAAAGAFDERPPVSADSPEFRQAWLQRIRERLARGENQAARDSLQEFRRRYPDVELPEDLRKLAATLPPPAP